MPRGKKSNDDTLYINDNFIIYCNFKILIFNQLNIRLKLVKNKKNKTIIRVRYFSYY